MNRLKGARVVARQRTTTTMMGHHHSPLAPPRIVRPVARAAPLLSSRHLRRPAIVARWCVPVPLAPRDSGAPSARATPGAIFSARRVACAPTAAPPPAPRRPQAAQLRKLIPLADRVLVKRVVQEARVRGQPGAVSRRTATRHHARTRAHSTEGGRCCLPTRSPHTVLATRHQRALTRPLPRVLHPSARPCRPPAASCCPRPARS